MDLRKVALLGVGVGAFLLSRLWSRTSRKERVEVVVHGGLRVNGGKQTENVRVYKGEGAIWDSERQVLWWVSIDQKLLFCYDPRTKTNKVMKLSSMIGTVVPRRTRSSSDEPEVVGAMGNPMPPSFVAIRLTDKPIHNAAASATDPPTDNREKEECIRSEWQSVEEQLLARAEDLKEQRFNDGKCDPLGRLWAGTTAMSEAENAGSMYVLDSQLKVTKAFDNVTIPNGIVWAPAEATSASSSSSSAAYMYHIDTPRQCVHRWLYDAATGRVGDRSIAFRVPTEMGYPDGMTIDREGMVWIAHWGGGRVTRWNPSTGELLRTIKLPVSKVTSVAFGGPDLADLYITTASVQIDLSIEPLAGSLLVIRAADLDGVKGTVAAAFRG